MVRRLQREERPHRREERAERRPAAVVLPAGFPDRVPGPPRASRLVGVTADAAEGAAAATVVYSARIESRAPLEEVRTHYLAALHRAGFAVTSLLAATDRFDADAVLEFHGHGCAGEVLVDRARRRTDIAVVVRVDEPGHRAGV